MLRKLFAGWFRREVLKSGHAYSCRGWARGEDGVYRHPNFRGYIIPRSGRWLVVTIDGPDAVFPTLRDAIEAKKAEVAA